MNQYINDINVIIVGDTNVNMLKPNLLKDCLDINGLRNVIKEPTCFKCTPSLIYLWSPKGAKVYPASRRRSNKRVGLKRQLAPHCVP